MKVQLLATQLTLMLVYSRNYDLQISANHWLFLVSVRASSTDENITEKESRRERRERERTNYVRVRQVRLCKCLQFSFIFIQLFLPYSPLGSSSAVTDFELNHCQASDQHHKKCAAHLASQSLVDLLSRSSASAFLVLGTHFVQTMGEKSEEKCYFDAKNVKHTATREVKGKSRKIENSLKLALFAVLFRMAFNLNLSTIA